MGFMEEVLPGDDFIRILRFHRLPGDADTEKLHDEVEGARDQEDAHYRRHRHPGNHHNLSLIHI